MPSLRKRKSLVKMATMINSTAHMEEKEKV